jgi:hypothetical protein
MSLDPIKQSLINRRAFHWFQVVCIIGIVIRLLLFFVYVQVSYNDTASYWRSAEAVTNGFTTYDGTRTPGYPVFLAIVRTERMAYSMQLVMGLIVSLVLFYLGWKLSDNPAFGALIGLAHTLNAGQIFFEANLLTETLTTFWLVISILLVFIWLKKPIGSRNYLLILSGLTSSLAALTRPLFIFFPVWLALILSFQLNEKKIILNWRPIIYVLLPAVFLVGGWMAWVNARFGVFNLTTMGGYHLVQHTGYYFEDVPEKDAVIRDIYLQYRNERIATTGTQGNTIWDAIPAIQQATGLSFYDLAKELQRISIELIKTHPGLYIKYVIKGWWLFWRAPVYWSIDAMRYIKLISPVMAWIMVTRIFLIGSNMVFILSSSLALFWKKIRDLWQIKPILWIMASTVWITSILQSLLDHGDNPRFLVPIQSICVFWVLWIGYYSLKAIKPEHQKVEAHE